MRRIALNTCPYCGKAEASLEPAFDFRGEYTTVVVNAQGCGVILREQLRKELSVMVKLVTNGRSNKGHVVFSIPLSDTSSHG